MSSFIVNDGQWSRSSQQQQLIYVLWCYFNPKYKMSLQKVAVVTGGNKGIGYAIVKGLCERFDGLVYLTARDVERGQAAVAQLGKENKKAVFHQLDINNQASVDELRDFIKKEHGGLDLLINNAAIGFGRAATESPFVQASKTIEANYFGTLRVCEALFSLLRNNAKVVNLSSALGHLSKIPTENLRNEFSRKDLTISELSKLLEKFVKATENNTHVEDGWGNSTYAVSKVGVTALTIIQQRLFDEEQPNRNISINAVHPGYVKTDMTSHNGLLSIEEGARSALFAALDADLKGKYIWKDCTLVDWYSKEMPNPPY
ncbi:carbonyl reductase [NADPH] 3-like [Diabrotica virgifera virgifera]|uniref:carbonyl reductase (NADPH) n=2 Tax=Diabrotica virgifera virgifera TaxID=50390 RepID=A0ABM5K9R3_DIAVI|nr:carbonyl reductase [NADPH] 3-like [Diabrotica virgifera virgifera]